MNKNKNKAIGASMVETIIVFPIMMLIGFAVVHLGLIYQAKSNLKYAAFQTTKMLASNNLGVDINGLGIDWIESAQREVCSKMQASDTSGQIDCNDSVDLNANVRIRILRPSRAMFRDWGVTMAGDPLADDCAAAPPTDCKIPNDNLLSRDPTIQGAESQVNIQDANIITLEVSYLYDTGVPFMNTRFFGEDDLVEMQEIDGQRFETNPFERYGADNTARTGVWVSNTSTFIMQSDAVMNSQNYALIVD